MAQPKPIAFMSYARADDADGRLTRLRELLSAEVRRNIGEEFLIFQDTTDIRWGQNWKERIEESIDWATFLIPIITPGFFRSLFCRLELERFVYREKELGSGGLILPIYYMDTPLLDDPARRATDELAQVIAGRQFADWRGLRLKDLDSAQVQQGITHLAGQVNGALKRESRQFSVGIVKEALRTGGLSLIKRPRRKGKAVR